MYEVSNRKKVYENQLIWLLWRCIAKNPFFGVYERLDSSQVTASAEKLNH